MTRAADLAKLIAGGGTITVDDNSSVLSLESTDADANDGPLLSLSRDSSSPADGDLTGKINFNADNDAGQVTAFSSIRTFIRDASDGTEDGAMQLNHMLGGSEVTAFEIDNDEYVINQGSNDVDFRVESNGNANMLVIDGGNDIASIGRAVNSSSTLAIQNKDDTNNNAIDVYNDNGNRTFSIQSNTSGDAQFKAFRNDGTQGFTLLGDGSVTNPLQPAFLALVGSAQNNIALDSTVAFQFNTEVFDQNSDFDHSTNYRFTAPVTGKYQLNFKAYYTGVPSDAEYIYNQIVTSNRNYISIFDPRGFDAGVVQYWQAAISVLADMDANDTASVIVYQRLGSQTLDITGGSGADPGNTFSGFLVC
jgi:hypothetical protein